jgi:ankyrin repeat protein
LMAARSMDVANLSELCGAKPSKNNDVNSENEDGQTALMAAVDSIANLVEATKKPDVTVVKSLLKAGANPNVQYKNGDTVLMKIIRTSYLPLLEVLLENSMVTIDHNMQNKRTYRVKKESLNIC